MNWPDPHFRIVQFGSPVKEFRFYQNAMDFLRKLPLYVRMHTRIERISEFQCDHPHHTWPSRTDACPACGTDAGRCPVRVRTFLAGELAQVPHRTLYEGDQGPLTKFMDPGPGHRCRFQKGHPGPCQA